MNACMLSGRDVPPKPSDSSSRKDWRIASRENEKIDRNYFTMKKLTRRTIIAGAAGCVTFVLYSSTLVM